MFDRVLIAILLVFILYNLIPNIFPVIEGNTSSASVMTQQTAGNIQYLKEKLQKTLDLFDGNINDVYEQVDNDADTNTQNINDYRNATSVDTDPYSSGAYTETGN